MNNISFDLMRRLKTSTAEAQRDKSAIKLAATTYESLSPKEKEHADGDLYGTEEPVHETPELIEDKLAELDAELNLINEETKKCYLRALEREQQKHELDGNTTSSEKEDECYYVTSRKFKVMFLRADRFDAKAAAKRMTVYFKEKYDLFGEAKLASRICQVDLTAAEKMALVVGAMFTGVTDVAGRPVILGRRSIAGSFDAVCLKRVAFYLFQKVVEENEVAQQKGIVWIGYNIGVAFQLPTALRENLFPALRLTLHGLPVRIAAFHNFYESFKEHILMNFTLVVLAKNNRARFLAHRQDTHLECMLKMIRFGINANDFPMTSDGEIQYDLIQNYWDRQRQLET